MALDAGQLQEIEKTAGDFKRIIISIGEKIDGTNGTGFVNEISGAFSTNFQDYILGFKIILSVWLTAWIIYEGLQIAYGRNNKNLKDFMWDSFMKFVFISVCLYPDAFTNLLKNALDGIRQYTLGSGSSDNLYTLLGDFAYNVSKATNIMTTSSGFFNLFSDKPNAIVAYLSAIICYVGFFIGAAPVLITLAINSLSFYLLAAVIPIMFFCLIFGFLKNVFTQWMTMMISNIFTLIFVTLFCSSAFNYILPLTVKLAAKADAANSFLIGGAFIFYGILLKVFITLATSMAQNLTQVSMEGAARAGLMQGAAMAGAGVGLGAAAALKYGRYVGGGWINPATNTATARIGEFVGRMGAKGFHKFNQWRNTK
ncbi:hypothetical protein CFVI02298_04395 [Campylobacter fetus subsp. venerealis cfvi02/298]|nr:hypothetical protein CFVI02298_04395 [Campylobacter fetus subsp. venerealis cfvi02/298]